LCSHSVTSEVTTPTNNNNKKNKTCAFKDCSFDWVSKVEVFTVTRLLALITAGAESTELSGRDLKSDISSRELKKVRP
jgi:hypothetical protein